MSSAPLPTPEMTSHHQDVLNDLVDIGHELARMAFNLAKAGTATVAQATSMYDRLTRSIRRSIWLVRKLAEPLKTVDRVAARKQIIRTVEDTIQRSADQPAAETLHAELMERLDTSDLEDEINGRRVEDIIADICRDLGLAASPLCDPWKRRKPRDLALLQTRAAARPSQPNPKTRNQPQLT
jgi:hypothetical protein